MRSSFGIILSVELPVRDAVLTNICDPSALLPVLPVRARLAFGANRIPSNVVSELPVMLIVELLLLDCRDTEQLAKLVDTVTGDGVVEQLVRAPALGLHRGD